MLISHTKDKAVPKPGSFFKFNAANADVTIVGRRFSLPKSRIARVLVGMLLIAGGIFGFLPVLGFWMVPLGLLILSLDIAYVRRLRRRLTVWWQNRRKNGREI